MGGEAIFRVLEYAFGRSSRTLELKLNEAGIWTIDGTVGLGCVVLLETSDGEILLIRKAHRPLYEFSGQLALPGGMVRSSGTLESHEQMILDLEHTLYARLADEAGLTSSPSVQLMEGLRPVITSYNAKGARRYTLVVAFNGLAKAKYPLQSRSSSVESPQWTPWEQLASSLGEVAPANRLILGAYLWRRMRSSQRETVRACLDEALNACGIWASDLGLVAPSAPWISPL